MCSKHSAKKIGYWVSAGVVYVISVIKIVCTYVLFAGVGTELDVVKTVPFTVISVPLCLAAAYDEKLAVPITITLLLTLLLWLVIILLSLLGIWYTWAQKGSIFGITLATCIDLVLVILLQNNPEWETMGIIVPSVALLICGLTIICMSRTKRNKRHKRQRDGSLVSR